MNRNFLKFPLEKKATFRKAHDKTFLWNHKSTFDWRCAEYDNMHEQNPNCIPILLSIVENTKAFFE